MNEYDKSQYTRLQRLQNWWYYHKVLVIAAVIVVVMLIPVAQNLLGIGVVEPDYQIACVTKGGISDKTAEELCRACEALGQDLNGDGKVVVNLVSYNTGAGDQETTMYFGYASTITIQADIELGESQFFLIEEPERFQIAYQLLADENGKLPPDEDYSIDGRCFSCEDLALNLSDSARKELSGLFLGRRGYIDESKVSDLEAYGAFWKQLWRED